MFFKPDVPKAITPLGRENRGSALPEEWELRIFYQAECKVSGVWGVFTRVERKNLPQMYETGILDSVWSFIQDKPDCGILFTAAKIKGKKVLYEKVAGAIETFCPNDAQSGEEPLAPCSMFVYDQGDFCFDRQIDHPDEQTVHAEIQKILNRSKAVVNGRFYAYPAIFNYADDGISVSFPDLPGCLTCADTTDETYWMAKDALAGHLAVRMATIEKNGAIPAPTPVDELHPDKNERVYLIEITLND